MKTFFKLSLFFLFINTSFAQNYKTTNGHIWFISDAPRGKIEAHNKKVICELDILKGEIDFTVNMKSFEFENSDMQAEFNSKYVESEMHPKALFKGFIRNMTDINFINDGTYNAEIEGSLTIHGITKVIKQTGTFTVNNGRIFGKSDLHILLSDYGITIPQPVINNINNYIDISVDLVLDKSLN